MWRQASLSCICASFCCLSSGNCIESVVYFIKSIYFNWLLVGGDPYSLPCFYTPACLSVDTIKAFILMLFRSGQHCVSTVHKCIILLQPLYPADFQRMQAKYFPQFPAGHVSGLVLPTCRRKKKSVATIKAFSCLQAQHSSATDNGIAQSTSSCGSIEARRILKPVKQCNNCWKVEMPNKKTKKLVRMILFSVSWSQISADSESLSSVCLLPSPHLIDTLII